MPTYTGFIGPAYALNTPNAANQTCKNYFLEQYESGSGKNSEIGRLKGAPGTLLWAAVGSGPTRGQWKCGNGRSFVVSGDELWELFSDQTATIRGTLLTSSGAVGMAENGVELMITDGNGYLFTFATDAFAQIVDPDLPTADMVVYIDTYFIVFARNTGQFYISAQLDGTSWDALDFASTEGLPDSIVGILASQRELVIGGALSIEIWFNSGEADFPFARREFYEMGLGAAHSLCEMDASYYYVTSDRNGAGMVYRGNQRISTFPVEEALKQADTLSECSAWTYQDGGHSFYCLNVPGLDYTWVYDAATGLWHQRTYYANGVETRHRGQNHQYAFDKHIIGDYENGNLYYFDDATYSDVRHDDTTTTTELRAERSGPSISRQGERLFHSRVQIDMETGRGPIPHLADGNGDDRDPYGMLSWSDDGGHTYPIERQVSLGRSGEYKKRAFTTRLGSSRDRRYKWVVTDPVPRDIIGCFVEVQ